MRELDWGRLDENVTTYTPFTSQIRSVSRHVIADSTDIQLLTILACDRIGRTSQIVLPKP